ncbi:acyltransferase [Lactococcus lactis]|uniref:Acyltransferase n=1 Tax=Lactococcus lactis subsp. lactis TaxID=1360 RepID=A0AAJ4MKH2_LACLL|nr:acyltransferase [Lactococcus lactis]QRZ33793.1 acyltransferase [Lactococcus lactis subsp. lactis]
MQNSFYSKKELENLGFKSIGCNVSISKKSSIYGINNISIGDNVRIDDFTILSGKINIENNIHIAAYSALYGGTKGIFLKDFSNISSRVTIYAVSDDYSGESLTSPMVPEKYKTLDESPVIINKHVIIGSTSVILPGVDIGEGCAIGSLSLVKNSLKPWGIYAGSPVKKVKSRSKKIIELETKFLAQYNQI